MYKVWIDYKDGSHKENIVQDAVEADNLKTEWEARADWRDSGFVLLADTTKSEPARHIDIDVN